MRFSSWRRLRIGALVPFAMACNMEPTCPIELVCIESADMKFEGQESLEAGTYTLSLTYAGGTTMCTARLDEGGVLLGAENSDAAGGENGEAAFSYHCDGLLERDMTLTTDENDRIVSIGVVTRSPEWLELQISRDDTLVLQKTVEFDYPAAEEGCDAPCRQAEETVKIP